MVVLTYCSSTMGEVAAKEQLLLQYDSPTTLLLLEVRFIY